MGKFLIVKTGSTVPPLRELGEDFEDWFVDGAGLTVGSHETVAVFAGESLPDPRNYCGVMITGSPAFVTDLEAWSEQTADFIRDAVANRIPLLGICYGHQLLAHALGGLVDFHPGGREIGTVEVRLNAEGRADSLLGDLPELFSAQVSHSQSVICLPDQAILLAGNAFEPHHAFRVGDRAWGLQFHPEFDERIVSAYINDRRVALEQERLDPDALLSQVRPAPESTTLLKRFVQLASA